MPEIDLLSICHDLTKTRDVDQVLTKTLGIINQEFNCEAATIFLLETNNRLRARTAVGGKIAILNIELSPTEGIIGAVIQSRGSVRSDDAKNDPRVAHHVDSKTQFVTKNILATPLIMNNKVIGVIELINKQGGTFNDEDQVALEKLAPTIALGLDNSLQFTALQELMEDVTSALGAAIEKRDPYTGGHTERVTGYSMDILDNLYPQLHLLSLADQALLQEYSPAVFSQRLRIAARLHDVGKIGVPDEILRKPEPLNPEERKIMQEHAIEGARIVQEVRNFADILPGIGSHHETFDGSGYPQQLSGDKIPLIPRIIAVADTYDAMTTDRPYRQGLAPEIALAEIKKQAGRQFDPAIVTAFLSAKQSAPTATEEIEAPRPLHVLIADDDTISCQILARLAQRLGHQTTIASNGQELLTYLLEDDTRFDVALVDLRMPIMSGIDAIQQYRQRPSGRATALPTYAISAQSPDCSLFTEARNSGMVGQFTKPIDLSLITKLLTELSTQKR